MRFGDALLAPAKWRLNSKRWADKEWCEREVAGSPGEQERQRRLERAARDPGHDPDRTCLFQLYSAPATPSLKRLWDIEDGNVYERASVTMAARPGQGLLSASFPSNR
ncbi:hypothetical protein V2G26_001140 [Clonostachys chloroleuca]